MLYQFALTTSGGPDEHLDVIAIILEPPVSCCGGGGGSRSIENHAVNLGNRFVICFLHWVIVYCLRVISSYPLSGLISSS